MFFFLILSIFIRYLAESYASKHAYMAKNDHLPCDGINADDAFTGIFHIFIKIEKI